MLKKGLIIAVILSFCCTGNAPALNVSYKYDSLSRLVEVLYENTGKIEYTYDAAGNHLSQKVTVGPTISVIPANRNVTKDAGTTTFSVANIGVGTMPWTAAVISGGGWLRITSGSSGNNDGTITCAFDANPDTSARTGTVRVTAAGATGTPKDVTVTQAPTTTVSLAASFAGLGLWVYNPESATWTQISTVTPENMIYSGSTLYGDFGSSGLWKWNGAAWSQLTSVNPENMVTSGSVIYADFGSSGLWKWNGTAWSQLTSANPENMVISGSTLYVDFGAAYGLYKWDGTVWAQLTPADPENMVISGSTLYVDFGAAYGLYKRDSTAWAQLTPADPENMVTSVLALFADFGGSGLWKWDGTAWAQLTSANSENMVASDSALYTDFGAPGLWKWDGAAWAQLTSTDPSGSMVVAGSTLYVDFGSSGIWKWTGSGWSQLTGSNSGILAISN